MVIQKKGQFYLLAVLIMSAMLIGILSITNFAKIQSPNRISEISNQIPIEKNYVFDYIVNNNLNNSESQNILTNFSNNYIDEIGTDKDIFFISGTNSSINLIGNKASNESIYYNVGNGPVNITQTGKFNETLSTNGSISLNLPEGNYYFSLFPGQNLYYLIKYNYSNEVYIEHD